MDEMNFQPEPKGNKPVGMSVASMVLGICSIIFICIIPYLPLLTGIIGIVLAAISLKNEMGGKGMAIAGLVLSIIAVVIYAIILIFGAAFLAYFGDYASYM